MKGSTVAYPLAVLFCAGCASGLSSDAVFPAASVPTDRPLQPLTVGWQQYFKLDWQPSERRGRPVVEGRIFNNWGFGAINIRLLVTGLDPSGHVVEQKLLWLGTDVLPGTSAQFQVPLDRPAAAYDVAVFSYDWLQRGGGGGTVK